MIMTGLIIADIQSTHASHQYIYHLLSNLFESIGIAILVANIFSFVIGTDQFMEYIRERLINIEIKGSEYLIDKRGQYPFSIHITL